MFAAHIPAGTNSRMPYIQLLTRWAMEHWKGRKHIVPPTLMRAELTFLSPTGKSLLEQ